MCYYTIENLKRFEESGNPPKETYFAELTSDDGEKIAVQFAESTGTVSMVYEKAKDAVYPIIGVLTEPKPLSAYRNGDVLCLGTSIPKCENE